MATVNPGNSGGVRTDTGATSGSTGLATITFATKYAAVEVKNLDGTNPLYITTGSVAAAVGGGNDEYVAGPGERVLVPNNVELWWQGYGGIDGTLVNPGTTVNIAAIDNHTASKFEVNATC